MFSDLLVEAARSTGAHSRAAMPLAGWLDRQRIEELLVVSPHLDDGIFSAHTLLASPTIPRRRLATVFSDAPGDEQSDWCRLTGFATCKDEFIARRLEDRSVAEALGVECLQIDEHAVAWSPAAAERVADRLVATLNGPPERALAMLPAGAGRRLTPLEHWLRRALKRPMGTMPHSEHLAVRDLLLPALRQRGLQIGFYAEIPYVWADRIGDLHTRLGTVTGLATTVFESSPDVHAKQVAALGYGSQIEHILGFKPEYQRRVLSHPEVFFLPG